MTESWREGGRSSSEVMRILACAQLAEASASALDFHKQLTRLRGRVSEIS
jgi:hypothetical protein